MDSEVHPFVNLAKDFASVMGWKIMIAVLCLWLVTEAGFTRALPQGYVIFQAFMAGFMAYAVGYGICYLVAISWLASKFTFGEAKQAVDEEVAPETSWPRLYERLPGWKRDVNWNDVAIHVLRGGALSREAMSEMVPARVYSVPNNGTPTFPQAMVQLGLARETANGYEWEQTALPYFAEVRRRVRHQRS